MLTKTVLDIAYQHNDLCPLIRSVYMSVPTRYLLIPRYGHVLAELI